MQQLTGKKRLLGCILYVAWVTVSFSVAAARAGGQRTIDVHSEGVPFYRPDDSLSAGKALEAVMKHHRDATLFFPPGKYGLAVSKEGRDGLVIGPEFHGTLLFAPGASIVCTAPTITVAACVHLREARHVSIKGLSLTYANTSYSSRMRVAAAGYGLLIDDSSDITLADTFIDNAPGACLWSSNSSDFVLRNIRVSHCTADGVHFENGLRVDLADMWSSQTQDDGLAFTSLESSKGNCGARARNVHIADTATRGIAVLGGCDITVSNFLIERTGVSGVIVDTDETYRMRRPKNVSFENGTISQAGVLVSSSGSGNKFGVEISAADQVRFEGVKIVGSKTRGFDASHGSTDVSLTNSTIQGGQDGINLIQVSGIRMMKDEIRDTLGYGVFLARVRDFNGNELTLANVSTAETGKNLHRSFWAEESAGPVKVDGLKILDEQPVATGYIVGCDQFSGPHVSIRRLSSAIHARNLSIECAGDIK